MTPRATYRLQFHAGFTFADAEALVPYLADLGISHVYASPITTARSGSTHGYDVVDPTRINPELGGEDEFRSLVAALRERGMGMIIDIVPNHMGVSGGENPWWQDVLARGRASAYARFFDIDWDDKILLPVLGTPLGRAIEDNVLELREEDGRFVLVAYGEHRFPIRDEDQAGLVPGHDPEVILPLLERQHYRLASWRTADDDLNWRRFFTISELGALRVEDPEVFEAAHALYFRLYGEGLIDGLRVDHVDGLTDPARYCRRLRERIDAIPRPEFAPPGPAYIVVEKILGDGETLAEDWGVDGTSGYDFMEQVSALLHDPAGEVPLDTLWREVSGNDEDFAAAELTARREILSWAFEGQLSSCVDAFAELAASAPETDGISAGMLRRAIERMLWVFPVYRTYGTGSDAPASDARVRETVRERIAPFVPPGEAPVSDHILGWLAGEGPGDPALAAEAVRRFQQLSAPIAAKAVEDTAFYRYGRLLSRNDVGFDPARFAMPIADFHAAQTQRAASFPHGMLATATHDHKRGEDVRARLAVLSELPDAWHERVRRWEALAGANDVDPADRYMLWQTVFGAWPEGLGTGDRDALAAFGTRVADWQQKALREAKLRSSWEAPDTGYEDRCRAMIARLLDPAQSSEFLADMVAFVDRTAPAVEADALVQLALRNTVPGVPDLYQGAELADFSLVDPDNRRPVDYAARRQMLAADAPAAPSLGGAKFALLCDLFALRRVEAPLFGDGDYLPLETTGPRARHILAFERRREGRSLVCAMLLHAADELIAARAPRPRPEWWGDTRIVSESHGMVAAADLFACAPVAWIAEPHA
ncbi:malto-oligosyltrehalose synthase [Stakelama tenebrarum]|uniref:Malto-oligosyltrehalose synthase n=1 Tax=Stakelama tenebrarum TaxID=2711215 RepID=A0A6G6Y1T4_9SPHN|nr:malto-oligosyltrehalose synthase [Sphingosinithalassobacter tenebrarum]QIG78885.1 malto-oligosyltrehalose synthase [Sphingosinithalassobacter tenebrarum]